MTIRFVRQNFTYWEDDGWFVGYLNEFPDYWTQGESLEDLKIQLRDLYANLNRGEISGIPRVAQLEVA